MSLDQTQRHFSRIPFDALARIRSADGSQQWPCTLYDVSLNGALTSQPAGWTADCGDDYQLELQLGNKYEEELCLHMNVVVAHLEDKQVGFKIEQMDVDTASHLHRLVELNLGDTELLKREFSELIKQH